METRLPAHLEVAGLIRSARAEGGFATVLQRGERDSGVILLLTLERGTKARLWERMPQLDGARIFTCTREENAENGADFAEYLTRRTSRDSDSWLIELDIDDPPQFVATLGT